MTEEQKYPIVEHKTNKTLYRYLGNDTYENIETGVTGQFNPATATKHLSLCVDLSQMVFDYPDVLGLIKLLGLKRNKN